MTRKLEKIIQSKDIKKPIRQPELDIHSKVIDFYNTVASVKDHRYKSWENCHNYFKEIHDNKKQFKELNEQEQTLAQLQLSFYLASWGMYRGSTFTLQKDYTICKNLVEEVLKPDYNLLWDIQNNSKDKEELNNQFKELYNKIHSHLKEVKKTIKNHKDLTPEKIASFNKEKISDTLITKIILGTMGCVPAYDRYFMKGLGIKGFQSKFNQDKSLINLLDFYQTNKNEIDSISQKINYTPMKIIDMYFWKIGYDADSKKE